MYDYVDGKVDWMAHGLPVEGEDGPFLGARLSEVATCEVGGRLADARRVLGLSGAERVVLVTAGGLAVGEVDRELVEASEADDVPLLDVLRPVPSTVRPSVTVASVADAGGASLLITTSDGRLLGHTVVEATEQHHDHDHDHDHEGHDHGGPAVDTDRYATELASVMNAAEERFGDGEPSAAELRAFFVDRLVAEGRSTEEADRFLDQLEPGDAE